MLQELTDLDFDTYFDVASSNQSQQQQQQQQQQQSNRDILYHDDSAATSTQQQQQQQQQSANINSLSSLLNNSNNNANNRQQIPSYQYAQQQQQQQQQSFNLFDWDLNPASTTVVSSTPSQNQSPMQISPISSPQSSSDGYTSHSLSPQMMSSPPLYAYNSNNNNDNQRIKDEASKALEGFFAKRSLYSSVIHNVPGINIPTTPITENPPVSTTTNLPSPPLENPLSGAFSAIDQWCQLREQDNVIHPLEMNNNNNDNNNEHQIRNWRKTATRHQQLQQPQSNLLDRPEPGKQLKKVAHNAIERRYRNNINDRIRELKNVVPALYKARIREKGEADDESSESGDENEEEIVIVDGVEVAKKLNKATILRKATEYIQFLKNTNDSTEKENLILQQIIAQMPGGQDVLAHFLCQKNEFEKAEQDRLARERREAQEREKAERQRLLRERAAQRAALAQLLPKPERRPYRRRQSSKNNTKAASKKASVLSSSDDDHIGNNKMFMAAFMCIAFFSTSPISSSSSSSAVSSAGSNNLHHASSFGSHDNNQTSSPSSFNHLSIASTLDFWQIIRYTLYTVGIFYICIVPLLLRWLRPRPVNHRLSSKQCLDDSHHHYASEVPTAWNRLYTNLVSIKNKSTTATNSQDKKEGAATAGQSKSTLNTLYDIFCYTLFLFVPRFVLALFYKNNNNAKPEVGTGASPAVAEEFSSIGASIRLNEVECLGGNQDVTRLGMLHSCIEMLAQLHKCNEKKLTALHKANNMARVYATIVMQLELSLPFSVSSLVAPYYWKRVIINIEKKKRAAEEGKEIDKEQLISNDWLHSDCHDQILQILLSRNAFSTTTYDNSCQIACCRNAFHSFVLPYITTPLDFILYWQELSRLQQCYFSYLNGTRPVFTQNQLDQVLNISTTTTAAGHMLQWFVRVGLTLQSLGAGGPVHQANLDALAEYTRTKVPQVNHQPSSNILRRHQTMIYNMMEAATALQSDLTSSQAVLYLQMAAQDRDASKECLEQIDASQNYEASVLLISTLAVHLRTLKALIVHQQTTFSVNKRSSMDMTYSKKLQASQASIYIAELRERVLRDMESPYTKTLSAKCKKHIQSYIYQADDTLSL